MVADHASSITLADVARRPVMPVVAVSSVREGVNLARALHEGGLDVIEVTLRTPAALDAVRAIRAELPDVLVGTGTVRRPEDATASLDAGAQFLVSPGTPARLADALIECGAPALPGCATASEAMALADKGFTALKFFPAEAAGGAALLKGLHGPLADLKFCPTGGVNPQNAADYLSLPNVICVGGTWVAPKDAVAKGDWARVTELAKAAAGLR